MKNFELRLFDVLSKWQTRRLKVETARFEVSGKSEVVKVSEAAFEPLGQLQQPVDSFHDAVGQPSLHVGQDTVDVTLDGTRNFTVWDQALQLGRGQLTFQSRPDVASKSILQKLTQEHRTPQRQIGAPQLGSTLLLRVQDYHARPRRHHVDRPPCRARSFAPRKATAAARPSRF